VRGKAREKRVRFEPVHDYFLEQQQQIGQVARPDILSGFKKQAAVEQIQVGHHIPGPQLPAGETDNLIEHAERIAKRAIRFFGQSEEGLFLIGNPVCLAHPRKFPGDVGHPDAVEMKDLTTRQYGG